MPDESSKAEITLWKINDWFGLRDSHLDWHLNGSAGVLHGKAKLLRDPLSLVYETFHMEVLQRCFDSIFE